MSFSAALPFDPHAPYDANVACTDTAIKELLAKLQTFNAFDRTLNR